MCSWMLTLQPGRPCQGPHLELLSTTGDRQLNLHPARRACGHCPTGESEFYAITKGSAHCLHSQAILKGFGVTVDAVVLTHASTGIGIASRQGCGRLKHLKVKWLWVQEKVTEKALQLRKHPTETNIADLATQYLTRSRMELLLAAGNLVLVSGERGMESEKESIDPGECVLINSVVKPFLLTAVLFLCSVGIFMHILHRVLVGLHS